MFKHILVAIDFTSAWETLHDRLVCMRDWGAERLTLVYVMSSRYPSSPEEGHRDHYRKRLVEAAHTLESLGYSVDWEIRTGEPGGELTQAAAERDADAIVAGSAGQGRVHSFFVGSTALDVLRLARVPVWMEPVGSECDECMDTIVLATDGSRSVASAEQWFVRLSPHYRRRIAVTAVSSDETSAQEYCDARSHLQALAKQVDDLDWRIVPGDATRVVVEISRELPADLTVLGKRGRNPMADLLLGSTAEAVARRARRPVLMVP